MAAQLIPTILLGSASGGGLLFAFEHSTLPGKIVMLLLFVGSVFSWTVMVTKFRIIRFAQQQRDLFLQSFRADRHPLRLFSDRARFEGRGLQRDRAAVDAFEQPPTGQHFKVSTDCLECDVELVG